MIAIALLFQCGRSETAERFNVLLITIDTLRADHVGAYGDSAARTPAMDRLAAEGVRFETAITAAPLTLPSHATVLTGLLPPQHGLRNNGAGKLREDTSTLATTLSAAGYRTGAFVGAFVLDRRFGLNHGFQEYDDDIPAARSDSARLEAERPADMVIDRAIAWMRKPDARPLFAWIHLYDPHAPYAAPDPFGAAFSKDPYRGEIAWVDSQVKRILDELDRQQISGNTIVVITGDHGEALGEHGEGTHGLLLYEPTLRVPLMIRAPDLLEPTVIRRPVGLVHLRSTLTAFLGLEKPGEQDLLRGKSEAVYSETHYPVLFGWSSLSATRDETWKLIQSSHPELYNLALDPGEKRNLYGQERRAMRKLIEAIAAVQRDAKQAAPAPLDEETRRKLASLGYVAPSGVSSGEPGANPVEKVSLFRRFEQAIGDLYGGQPQRAIAELEALATLDKNNPVFLSSLARAHRQHGKVGRAIELYREAVALRPEDAEGWYNLAASFQEAGDQRRAAEAIREAIRRDPSRPEAHNVLGIAYTSEGRFQEALQEFGRASELDPRNARAENNTGNVYRSLQKFDEAESAYRRAVALDALYPDPWNGLGTIEIERNQPKRAVQFFERALSLSPEAHEARLNRAVALQLTGDLDGALAAYRDFVRAVEGDAAFAEQRRGAEQMIRRISSRQAG